MAEGMKEDQESWRNFLRYLKQRGLKGVKLVISDKCLGVTGRNEIGHHWAKFVTHPFGKHSLRHKFLHLTAEGLVAKRMREPTHIGGGNHFARCWLVLTAR